MATLNPVSIKYYILPDPFGMISVGRNWEVGSEYRYGFNGKESDSETSSDGNILDYGFRIYNPRVGKFLSIDPLYCKFAYLSPYQFASNTPIMAIDLDGLEAVVVSIRPVPGGDPALTQVNIYKTATRTQQPTLQVTYNYYDAAGNLINSTTGTGFIPGSVESQLATSVDGNGVNGIDRLSAITPTGGTAFTTGFNFTINTIQDPQTSLGSEITALNGFSYDLNIEYNSDGFMLNGSDLSATNTPAEVLSDLNVAANTLSNPAVPITGIKGQAGTLTSLPSWTITVVGETDGVPSSHAPATSPNSQPAGNPALAQDRANIVAGVLRVLLPSRTINTDIVTGTGGADSSKRNIHLNITR